MDKKYVMKSALILNATNEKFDVVAEPISLIEIRKNKKHFGFDFIKLNRQGFSIYKIYKEGEPNIVQGMVAFRPSPGVLECSNMETNKMNQGKTAIYSGLGKTVIALCCKVSFDYGMDGYITFEAKNYLFGYYQRYGAILVVGNRMAIETTAAKKLVDIYF